MREEDLEVALKQWANDYGLGGMPREQSASILHKMMMYGCSGLTGTVVATTEKTVADRINDIVRQMESVGARYFRAAQCLRADYFCPKHYTYKDRIKSVRRYGIAVTRDEYYDSLAIARAYVLSALNSAKQ